MLHIPDLTERQSVILTRRRSGETFKAIAKSLGITPVMVRTHYLRAEQKDKEFAATAFICPHCSGKISLKDIQRQRTE